MKNQTAIGGGHSQRISRYVQTHHPLPPSLTVRDGLSRTTVPTPTRTAPQSLRTRCTAWRQNRGQDRRGGGYAQIEVRDERAEGGLDAHVCGLVAKPCPRSVEGVGRQRASFPQKSTVAGGIIMALRGGVTRLSSYIRGTPRSCIYVASISCTASSNTAVQFSATPLPLIACSSFLLRRLPPVLTSSSSSSTSIPRNRHETIHTRREKICCNPRNLYRKT